MTEPRPRNHGGGWLTVHPNGPGWCKRGHDTRVTGTYAGGDCAQCSRDKARARYAAGRGAKVAARRAAAAISADPKIILDDIQAMRERVRSTRCEHCGSTGEFETAVGWLCLVHRNQRLEALRAC